MNNMIKLHGNSYLFWRQWRGALQFLIFLVLSNRQGWAVVCRYICMSLHVYGILLWSSSFGLFFIFYPLFSSVKNIPRENQSLLSREETHIRQDHISSEGHARRKKSYGGILDVSSLQMLQEKRSISCVLSYVLHNTKPVGHQVYISTLSNTRGKYGFKFEEGCLCILPYIYWWSSFSNCRILLV